MIEIKNISKKYGEKTVVDNVTTSIEKGKITSFIGPNGAGKSTLLSIVSRLIPREGGQVLIEGKSIDEWDSSELARKISILRQSNNINIKLTVRELVEFGRFPYSKGKLTKEDDNYIDEALNYMKLNDLDDFSELEPNSIPLKWYGQFIINNRNASAKDVKTLVKNIQQKVQEKTGFLLECEIIFTDKI